MQISITPFVTNEEIYDWIDYQTHRFDLHFALVSYWAEREVLPLAAWSEYKERAEVAKAREIWIDLQPVNCNCSGLMDCRDKNRDCLVFQLPESRPEGLRVGSLGTISQDETHLKVWRSIIRFFKKKTKSGMWVLTLRQNVKGITNLMRYSPGIAELHKQGLKLLPFAGTNVLVFVEEPTVP